MFEYISAPEAAKNGVFRKGGYRSYVRMGAYLEWQIQPYVADSERCREADRWENKGKKGR